MSQFKLNKSELFCYLVLWGGCILGSSLVVPYALATNSVEVELSLAMIGAVANGFIIYPIPLYFGLLLMRKIPVLGLPFLKDKKAVPWSSFFKLTGSLGLGVALAITLIDKAFLSFLPELATLSSKQPSVFYGFLASFYGGIVEEVLMRFFLMGLLLFFFQKLGKAGVWSAIILTSIAFGIGHLPAMAQALDLETVAALSMGVITRVLVLNAVAGVVFGWLYWRKGLEYAMASHFMADIGLHVILPLLH